MTQVQKTTTPHTSIQDEMILVVKRDDLFSQENPAWTGLKEVDFEAYLSLIQNKKQFLPRSNMEIDPAYKQIIPYLIFAHNDHYFLMQRTNVSGEKRLHNKFTLGIGGHIREEDMEHNSIFEWARREFHEEVNFHDDFTIEPLGVINDDSNPVGQVHIGFVFLIKGSTSTITVNEELKSGQLVPLHECKALGETLESWSQFVVSFLEKKDN